MSEDAPEAPSPLTGTHRRIATVASLYNERYVDAMLDAGRAELELLLPDASLPVFRVPGAYEIPACAAYLARHAEVDAIIALGVVIRGETAHADLVAESVSRALQDLSVIHALPVINEVLLLDDEAQAEERCVGSRINRGVEAARAAVNMAELFQKLVAGYPPREEGDGD